MSMIRENINILGMSCNSCAKAIQSNINDKKGVENVKVNFQTKKLSFEYNKDIIEIKEIRMSIENMGYVIEDDSIENKFVFPKVDSTCSCG